MHSLIQYFKFLIQYFNAVSFHNLRSYFVNLCLSLIVITMALRKDWKSLSISQKKRRLRKMCELYNVHFRASAREFIE